MTKHIFIRVAARNIIELQTIHTPQGPTYNINWSSVQSAIPADQLPDPPIFIDSIPISKNMIQILFNPPKINGGQELMEYIFSWDSKFDFSTEKSVHVSTKSLDSLYLEGTLVYDLLLETPHITQFTSCYIRIQVRNKIGISSTCVCIQLVANPVDLPCFNGKNQSSLLKICSKSCVFFVHDLLRVSGPTKLVTCFKQSVTYLKLVTYFNFEIWNYQFGRTGHFNGKC